MEWIPTEEQRPKGTFYHNAVFLWQDVTASQMVKGNDYKEKIIITGAGAYIST